MNAGLGGGVATINHGASDPTTLTLISSVHVENSNFNYNNPRFWNLF